jgi:hypothetical protein
MFETILRFAVQDNGLAEGAVADRVLDGGAFALGRDVKQ